jgi:hypothetical protein
VNTQIITNTFLFVKFCAYTFIFIVFKKLDFRNSPNGHFWHWKNPPALLEKSPCLIGKIPLPYWKNPPEIRVL